MSNSFLNDPDSLIFFDEFIASIKVLNLVRKIIGSFEKNNRNYFLTDLTF